MDPLEQDSTTIIRGDDGHYYSHPKGDVDIVKALTALAKKQYAQRWWVLRNILPTSPAKITKDDGRTGVISAELHQRKLCSTFTPHATLSGVTTSLTVTRGDYGKGAEAYYRIRDANGQLIYDHDVAAHITDEGTYKLEVNVQENRQALAPHLQYLLIEYPTQEKCETQFARRALINDAADTIKDYVAPGDTIGNKTNRESREAYLHRCRRTPLAEFIPDSAQIGW